MQFLISYEIWLKVKSENRYTSFSLNQAKAMGGPTFKNAICVSYSVGNLTIRRSQENGSALSNIPHSTRYKIVYGSDEI